MREDKNIIGFELNEDELEAVSGGVGSSKSTIERHCDQCDANRTFTLVSGGRAICNSCKNQIFV